LSHTYHPLPAVAVDIVIFTVSMHGKLNVLLVKRRDNPFKGHLALPGGFVEVGVGYDPEGDQGESDRETAERELREETGLRTQRDGVFLEQLYTFAEPNRDPRGRVISIAYYALVGPDVAPRVRPGDDAVEADWFPVIGNLAHNDGPVVLAFDHGRILAMALERIRGKIDYDPRIARGLLPTEFTQKEFRRVHEIVKGETYDASNFSKRFRRMLEDGRFAVVDAKKELRSTGRPPRLYRFPDTSSDPSNARLRSATRSSSRTSRPIRVTASEKPRVLGPDTLDLKKTVEE
jgi:8-oxo-dGTP diphosphatase